jgi:glycosyltransferase involved in cell wall biosynthesis
MAKITVITPTHRRPDLLFQCIKAVQKSSFTDYEHLVIGDSCLWAKKVVDLFKDDSRIKYFETPKPHVWNAGASGKNVGIHNSTTEYIVYCDDDNIMLPNHLQVMYNELSSGTPICRTKLYEINLAIGEGSIRQVLEKGLDYKLEGGRVHRNDMQCIGHTRGVIESVGYWNSAAEIDKDHSWHKTATSEDDYLIRKFKNKYGQNFCVDLPDVSFLYYGRAACQNIDTKYDNLLSEDKLFVYPEILPL